MNTPSDSSFLLSLTNQRVLIIGGSSGIGAAVAQQALALGAHVIVAARSAEKLQPFRNVHWANRVQVEVVDIADDASVRGLFERVGAQGVIDHLVITAGPDVEAKPLATTDLGAAHDAFEVKFWGAVRAVQQALPYLAERASISLTSGLLSRKFVPGQLIKTSVNAALEAVGKQLAKELAPRRVNVISPGITATDATAGPDSPRYVRAGAGLPVGRVGRPEELAAAYIMAMSNGFISGAVLDIDGGGLL